MCNKQSCKYFLSGFFSVFRFGVFSFWKIPTVDIAEYIQVVQYDFNKAFEKLEKKHERN
jgi:hypothetical protein